MSHAAWTAGLIASVVASASTSCVPAKRRTTSTRIPAIRNPTPAARSASRRQPRPSQIASA